MRAPTHRARYNDRVMQRARRILCIHQFVQLFRANYLATFDLTTTDRHTQIAPL